MIFFDFHKGPPSSNESPASQRLAGTGCRPAPRPVGTLFQGHWYVLFIMILSIRYSKCGLTVWDLAEGSELIKQDLFVCLFLDVLCSFWNHQFQTSNSRSVSWHVAHCTFLPVFIPVSQLLYILPELKWSSNFDSTSSRFRSPFKSTIQEKAETQTTRCI